MKNSTNFPFFTNGFQRDMAKPALVNKADGTLVVPIVNLYRGFGSRSKLFITMLIFVVGLFTNNVSNAQILTFDFAGLTGDEATANSNTNNANLTSSTISRGAGLTASGNADRFNATSWALTSIANAVTGNDYMEFTITPNSGFQFSVSSIVFQIQRSASGISALALRSSLNSYSSNLDAEKAVVDNTSTQTITFTFTQSNSSTAVTYRLYGYAEATTGTGGPGDGTGNDITVNGSVTATGPSIAISSAHPSAGNINANSTDNIIGGFQFAVTNADATLTGISLTTAGTYAAGDIQTNGFKLWINSSNSLSGATQLGSSQAAVGTGGTVAVSGLSQLIATGNTRFILVTSDIASTAVNARTIGITSTTFTNITFSSGTKTGTNPVAASPLKTIVGLPNIAISSAHPTAGNVNTNSTNNIIAGFQFDVTNVSATLNSISLTTAGTYAASDIQTNGFKFWINSTNSLSGATQLGTSQAAVGTNGTVAISGLSQSIAIGTRYILLTADVASSATPGNTIAITTTAFSNIVFSSGNKTGTDPLDASPDQTIVSLTPNIAISAAHPGAGNVNYNTTDNIISSIQLDVTTVAANLTDISMTTAGTYVAGDIQTNGFKFWINSSNSLSGATQLGSSQAAVGSGGTVALSGLSQSLPIGTRYILMTASISATATGGNTIGVTSTPFSAITFTSGNKTGTDPVDASNLQTIVTPSVAISAAHPAAGTITAGNTNNIIGSVQLDVTLVNATLSSVSLTTSGTYTASDISTNGFKFWINSNNNLTGATQLGSGQAAVGSGGTVAVSGLSQSITAGTTRYILVTADVAATAINGRTIGITSTPFSSIVFANATKSGTDPVDASNLQTISSNTGATTIAAGPGSEPASFSSLINTQGAAVLNFDIDIQDDGAAPSTDALSTLISQMVFTQGTSNGVSNWTLAIEGAELSDGTNSMTGTVASTTITFAAISTADLGLVADDATKTYTLKVWLKTDLTSLKTTIDGLKLQFRIQNANITTDVAGSRMAAGQDQNSGTSTNAIDVQATTLAFVQNTSNANVSVAMTPAPTVSANDANGNRDLGYVTSVSMTSTGTLTGSPVSATPSAGLATFSTLTHTAAGTGLVLTAASGILSNATSNTFTVNDVTLAGDYFRSNATGTWATAASWQSSHDNSTWITSSLSPTFSANTITIQSGNVITIGASVTIDQVVINSGGTLSTSGVLTVNDGSSDDIIVQNGGTVVYTGGPGYNSGATIRVNSGGILSVQASGLTGNGSGVNASTHIYDDGAILNHNNASTFSASGVTYFPNASTSISPIFRITTVSGTPGGGSSTVVNGILDASTSFSFSGAGTKTLRNGISGTGALSQGSSGQFIINGTSAVITGTGTLTLGSSGLSISSSANITSDKLIAGSGPLAKQGSGTLTLSGVNTYTGGTTITAGTVELGAADVLANSGAIILSGGTLSTGSGTGFNETVGTLRLLTASSTIALGTGVHTLTFANSSGQSWTAGQTLTITGWTGTAGASGTAGKIFVGTNNMGLGTTQLAQVSFTGYSAGATILGTGELVPLTPSIAISSAHPAASNFPLNSTNNIVAGFRLDVTNNDATLNSVSVNTLGTYLTSDIQTNGFKFWINSTNDLSGATQLGSDQAVVVSGGLVTVSGLSQVIASGTTQYILFTADIAANAGRTIGITTTAFANITFSAGNKTGTNPVPASNASSLPIKLISFNATRQNNQTQLTFSTATEENNDFFAIERSGNGTDFRTIGKVNGAGTTTSIQNYTFTDETPLSGINYYRLKQVDFDGQFSYSPVATVVFDNKAGIRLAPSPVQDQLRVELEEMFQEDAQWQLYDFAGRLVQTGVLSAENMVFNVEVGSLTPGNYVIRVVSGQTTLTKQFQK